MSLDNLTGRATRAGRSAQASPPAGMIAATIATTPPDEATDVYVTMGAATQQTGPCLWMPRGDTLPARDDPCYVQQAMLGQWIVVWWRPA